MAENRFFDFVFSSENYKKMFESVWAGKSCSIFGIQNSMRPAISLGFGKKLLYITADNITANGAKEEFERMGLKTLGFKAIQDSFIYKKSQSFELYGERTLSLYNILKKNFDVVVTSIDALFSYLPSVSDFKKHIISLKVGDSFNHGELENLLLEAGYKREELIFEKGQFSRRGEVFDIFPINTENPYRIDFFDTEIESIKIFDIASQKGTKAEDKLSICPFTDLFLTNDEIDHLKEQVTKLKKTSLEDADLNVIFNAQVDEIVSRLELKDRGYSLDLLSGYLEDFRSSIFDYLNLVSDNLVVVFDEGKQIFDTFSSFDKENTERIKELKKAGTLLAKSEKCGFSKDEILKQFSGQVCAIFLKITNSNRFFESQAVYSYKTQPILRYTHNLKEFASDVKAFKLKDYKIYIFAGSDEQSQAIRNILLSHDVDIDIKKLKNIDNSSAILNEFYQSGFILPEEKIVVIGTYDIFPKKNSQNKLKALKGNTFNIPKVGDYVVHHYHGIGVCEGVTKLTGNLGTKDYVVVRYRDGDKLYVPTSHMDMLDKFTGAGAPTKLSKIGGQDFSAVKKKVKDSIKKLAFDLTELYATREKIKGFAFSEDNDLEREFENAFPYTETEDQLISIEEIKKDMQSQKVMDRLLCGDVGFGKTEVALRAAFKAIMDGKQVAFIAPTTILSEQHYNTSKARMNDFGVSIEVLNRFKSKAETTQILKKIESHEVDLICGTHRLLSDDVKFKDLGLIILDEEQKFGVEDKEKLKHKYPYVDVLTLSATPIPRTLNMSLSGIRDISVISTPPSERLPIQTYVMEYTESLVKDAISREIARDGQVFILYNSVEKIWMYAEKIKRLMPDISVMVAHGQMNSHELEKVVFDFYNKKADVLICTTIIENGINIENVNTLIVYDSDKLGLSQLYQIRGRVGRGSRMAYAYFTYEYNKTLTTEAYKRLDALSEFCEFGSGFKLAMRDLEIRGGGNILGAEQSGHLQKIGYDMYFKLLAEAVKEIKGEKVVESKDVLVKVALDAFVPDTYISTSEDRMIAYKRISAVDSTISEQKLKMELTSTYGKIPDEVENLISISLVRQLAQKINAVEIVSNGTAIDIVFDKKESVTENSALIDMVYKFRMNCTIDVSSKPIIRFKSESRSFDNFMLTKKFLLGYQDLLDKNLTKN